MNLLNTAAMTMLTHAAEARGVAGWQLVFCALTFLLGVSQLAVRLWNWLATLLLKPQLLPRLDYSPSGIVPASEVMTSQRNAEGPPRRALSSIPCRSL